MMSTLLTAAEQTPWWVYLIFAYLLSRGIAASKPQIVSIRKLTIIPIIFLALSIHTVLTAFHITAAVVGVWLLSLIVGSAIGWLLIRNHEYKVDRKKLLIQLQGSWLTLILILLIFASKYYFGYELGSDPALVNHLGFEFSMLAITGVCTGLFVGRLLCYLHKLQTCPSVDLTVSES